jgi:hypothetical protein
LRRHDLTRRFPPHCCRRSYDDRYGPAFLVFLLLVVTVTSIVLSINHADWHKQNNTVTTTTSVNGAAANTKASSALRAQSSELRIATTRVTADGGALSALGILNASAAASGGACGQLPVAWPPFFRPKGAAFSRAAGAAADEDTLLLGGDYALLQLSARNVTEVRLLPAPGWDIAGLAAAPGGGGGGGVVLGAARPMNTVALFEPATRSVSRVTDLGGANLLGGASAISALAAGPDGMLLVTGPAGEFSSCLASSLATAAAC